jgi:hypothetical protein
MVENKYRDDGNGVYWNGTSEEEQEYLAWYIPSRIKENRDALWQAATRYQESFISGAAIGLVTAGFLQNKPKSMAVMAWINNIWNNHYYVQKPLVNENYTGYDFSVCGPIPYTVQEINAEVLG